MKKMTIILIMVFSVVGFSVTAETSVKDQNNPPPLLENNSSPYTGNVNPGFPAYPEVPVQPGTAGPLPPPPGALMTPGAPVPPPPGAAFSGGYSAAYSTDITPKKIQQVLSTVKEVRQYLKSGKIWILKGPGGELEIRGGIMYQGAVVSVINFSPVNGSVLPAEYRPVIYQENVSLEKIKDQFEKIVNNMQILEGVWFSQPEACWIVPIAYRGEVIASLKIYHDGIHVIPDNNASREMAYYGS